MKELLASIVRSYEEGYDVLVGDLSRASDEALDWKVTPESITIGSSVLHIVGYELMLVTTLEGADVRRIRERSEWSQFEPGFQRQLGGDVPSNIPLVRYLELIEARRNDTRRFWRENAPGLLGGQTLFYRAGQEFKETGLYTEDNSALFMSLLGHARYHRGQITLLLYLFSSCKDKSFLRT